MSDEAMTSREQAPLNVAGPEPGLPLRDIPIVFVTRFSFFGKSSWKSEASRNREILFQPDRLKLRLKLLSAITLPSLAAQTSRDFHHFILTSRDLPEWAAVRLRAECARFHGDPSRYSIIAERPMPAPAALRQFLDARYGGHTVAQVALDDDDGLAADFVESLRAEFDVIEQENPRIQQGLPYFVSWSRGYGLVLRDTVDERPALCAIRYPYINLGLTMITAGGAKNILAIQHRKAPTRYGVKLIGETPMYVRSVHDFNDSRVDPGAGKWRPQIDWAQDEALKDRFSFLFGPDAGWINGA